VPPLRGKSDRLPVLLLVAALAAPALGGCAYAIANRLADTLAADGGSYASDDDPELIADAVPFALKTMEQVLDETPRHQGLLLALARGFAEYAYAFVQQDADRTEEIDVERSKELQARARRLYLRARDFGLRGLELRHPDAAATVRGAGPEATAWLASATRDDVPFLYWTAASWALAIADAKSDMRLVGDLPRVEKLMDRALALDESWDEGAIHEFYVAYDGARSASDGGGVERARKHLERALALSGNKKL